MIRMTTALLASLGLALTLAPAAYAQDEGEEKHPLAGVWKMTVDSPIGRQESLLQFAQNEDGSWKGRAKGDTGKAALKDVEVSGQKVSWKIRGEAPVTGRPMTLIFQSKLKGRTLVGMVDSPMGEAPFKAVKRKKKKKKPGAK